MYSHNNQLTWGTHDEPNEVYNREIKRRLEQWKYGIVAYSMELDLPIKCYTKYVVVCVNHN